MTLSMPLTITFCLAVLTSLSLAAEPPAAAKKYRLYIGTYTSPGGSKGIYTSVLDMAEGTLTPAELAATAASPSFLALHPSGRRLYAVGEVGEFAGRKSGGVMAFGIQPNGKLTLLNQQPSEGAGPCHVTVDAAGKNVLVANYGGGSAAVLPLDSHGQLGKATGFVQHAGSSLNKQRQQAPHAHSINLDAANRFAFVADLGLDQVLVYRFDAAKGTLVANDPPHVKLAAGAGPRHFAFHPSGRFAYVINELASTVSALAYDAQRGTLTELQTLGTLPAGFDKGNSTADIHVHPSGKFLYGSNRGHDSIAIYSIDASTGKLTAVGHQPSGGRVPRNFNLDPSGKFLLAANQDSDNVVVLRIDPDSGKLSPAGHELSVPRPVCVQFLAIE